MLKDYIYNKPIIKTSRLTLRPLKKEDTESLFRFTPDKALYKYWGKSAGKADKNPALLFEKEEKPTKSFHLGIEKNESGEVIGEIWVYLIENDRIGKVAYRISEAEKGQGFATEALSAMVEFIFTNTELKRLWSDVHVDNIPSCRVLEKCGFIKEGTIREGKMVSSFCNYHIYGLLRSDIF